MDSSQFDYDSLLSMCHDPDGQNDKSDTDDDAIVHQYDKCECGERMFKTENILQCSVCPNMKSYINDEVTGFGPATAQYNSGSLSYCRIRGNCGNGNAYQRTLYPKTSPEERKRKMVEHAMSKLNAFNSNESHDVRFPTHFLIEAANMLTTVQMANDKTLKDTVYVGALIRCLAIVCKKHKLYQKDQLFCTYAGIKQTNLTQRNQLIRTMHENGVIEYTKYYNPEESLFTQYFTMFKIPMKYKKFARELIEIATPRHMRGDNNNTVDSKCAAIVSILQRKLNLPFNDSDICTNCRIVLSTYEKFARYIVDNRDIVRPIFEKYDVPRLRSKDYAKKPPKLKKVVEVKGKRRRGRPLGSSNKAKPAPI